MQAKILVPFYCGTTQVIVNHVVEQIPAFWPRGTVVTVLGNNDHLIRIELPNGMACSVDPYRLEMLA